MVSQPGQADFSWLFKLRPAWLAKQSGQNPSKTSLLWPGWMTSWMSKDTFCQRMVEVKGGNQRLCSSLNLNFLLCLCIFRTSPPQMTSDPGTALRPWPLSRRAAPANIRTDWSYAVNPGTHPPPTHLTHPKETSRLKCEENTCLQQTERQLNPLMNSPTVSDLQQDVF